MLMRHGVPELKMKDDLIQIIYFVQTSRGSSGRLAIFYYSKRQVYYNKQEVKGFCRVAGVLRFIIVSLALVLIVAGSLVSG